ERMLTLLVVFAGVMSSLAADSGYVVLIPLAAMLFHAMGRSPLAGIAAAFARVSGDFSANLLIGPLDAILAGLSTEAAALVDNSYVVNAAGYYYFIVASVFMVVLVCTLVTEKLVLPRLVDTPLPRTAPEPVTGREKRALRVVGGFSLVFIALLLWGLVPDNGLLRDPDSGAVLTSPFINGIVNI